MRRFLVLLTFIGLGWAALLVHDRPVPEHEVANRPIQVTEDGYTSSQACRACHPDQYATWYGSYHRTMTQVARPDTVVASFDNPTVADVHGRAMTLSRRGPQFWATFDDPDWDGSGGAPPRIEREVVMVTGSHHQQIYWYATGQQRLLGQLPGAYLVDERRWIPRRMAVLHPPGDPVFSETGHWNSVCAACHTTHPKPKSSSPLSSEPLASQVVDTTTVEHGIACESCHGPGETHTRLNRNPLRRYTSYLARSDRGLADARGEEADNIVQPQRLTPQRSSQVCGQCHGIWEFYDSAGERHANSSGLPFRPGDDLSATRFIAQPTRNGSSAAMQALLAADRGFVRDSFWPDGKVRVSGREYNGLIESPCYAQATTADRTLTCFSCHTLHKKPDDPRTLSTWAVDQLGAGMDSDRACTQCHEPIAANITKHTKHAVGSSGSACYNCHMPYTTYGLLKTIRSHTVSSPSAAESVEVGRPNACNLCHLDKTLRWTSDAMERWYGQPTVTLGADEERIAAAVLWALRGDAGQRVVAAEAMKWAPAQRASGTFWMAPHLAQLLDDPYDAVRFSAGRAIRTLPGFATFSYDFVAGPQTRRQAQLTAMRLWDQEQGGGRPANGTAVLMTFSTGGTPSGVPRLLVDEMLRLIRQRDNRRMLLRE